MKSIKRLKVNKILIDEKLLDKINILCDNDSVEIQNYINDLIEKDLKKILRGVKE